MATTDALIISAENVDHLALLRQCKFDNFVLNRNSVSHGKFSPSPGSILIVENKQALVIFADLAQTHFLDAVPSEVELSFHQHYQGAKLLAYLNQTTSNSYLFNYIEDGARRRIKSGSSDAIYIDEGTELLEETKAYQKKHTEEGIVYLRDGHTYTHDQVGASQAEWIAERILGYPYWELWSDPDLKSFEYVSVKQTEDIFVPQSVSFNRFSGLTQHLRKPFHRNDLLDQQIQKLLVPFLQEQGFRYDPPNNLVTKTVSTITQDIQLIFPLARGNHSSQLSCYHTFRNPTLAEQLITFFGTKRWNPRNPKLEISDQFILSTNFLDQRTVEANTSLHPFNYDKLGVVLKAYLVHSVLPIADFYFDILQFYHGITNPLISIAALLLNDHQAQGLTKMKKYLQKINYPNHTVREQYQVDIYERLLAHTGTKLSLAQVMTTEEETMAQPVFTFADDPIVLQFTIPEPDKETKVPLPSDTDGSAATSPKAVKKASWWQRMINKIIGKG